MNPSTREEQQGARIPDGRGGEGGKKEVLLITLSRFAIRGGSEFL